MKKLVSISFVANCEYEEKVDEIVRKTRDFVKNNFNGYGFSVHAKDITNTKKELRT